MKINQTTLEKIKAYILNTQKNSTYNSAPHEPLEMCWNPNTAYQWNMCNCYCYLNRYLATDGEKKGNVQDLLKCCHYAWLDFSRLTLSSYYENTFDNFKILINQDSTLEFFFNVYILEIVAPEFGIPYEKIETDRDKLIPLFLKDKQQVNKFWHPDKYFQLATLLIQQHETEQEDNGKTDTYGNYYIDLETT
jgi:hypothetical protein